MGRTDFEVALAPWAKLAVRKLSLCLDEQLSRFEPIWFRCPFCCLMCEEQLLLDEAYKNLQRPRDRLVLGRRRLLAAIELGREVRAVVRGVIADSGHGCLPQGSSPAAGCQAPRKRGGT